MASLWTLLALALLLLAFGKFALSRRNSNLIFEEYKLPRCMPYLPIVGSLPFLKGGKDLHLVLTEAVKKYGDIFSIRLGAKYFVVLNGYDAIREALHKKSEHFAGRGKFNVDGFIWTDPGKGIILGAYGPRLRKIRKDAITVLKSFGYGSRKMEEKIQMEVKNFLEYIRSQNGEAWCPGEMFEKVTLNVIYNLMFGHRFDYDDDVASFLIHCCHKIADSADAMYDVFPLVFYFPNVRKTVEEYKLIYREWLSFLDKKVKECLSKTNEDSDNFVSMFTKIYPEGVMDIREMATVVRDLMIGGTETTSGQLSWALILLANNPEIQSRLQQDLDSLVPRDRLPALEDRSKLPYLEATILEIMRIRTAVPLSLPHCTTMDTELRGYHLPANTEVIVNLWSAHMDPNIWPEPHVFRPERFLDKEQNIINRERVIPFSLGKRSCLGEILARQEMFLLLAAMIHQFKVTPPEGEVKVKDEMTFLRTLNTQPHLLRMIPR